MREMGKLPPGWKVTELLPDDPKVLKHRKEVDDFAKILAAIPREKPKLPTEWNGKPVKDLDAKEKEEFYFSLQPKSTQEAILAQRNRRPEDDLDHLLRPMPDCVANPNAKSLDELTSRRPLDPSEVLIAESLRKSGRNALGQSTGSSASSERKEKATWAFTYSPPAEITEKDFKRIEELKPLKAVVAETPPPKAEKKLPLRERLRLWFDEKFGDWIY